LKPGDTAGPVSGNQTGIAERMNGVAGDLVKFPVGSLGSFHDIIVVEK